MSEQEEANASIFPEPSWTPDWRNEASYPQLDCDGWTKAWRWEFIRRNPEYVGDMERWNIAVSASFREEIEKAESLFPRVNYQGAERLLERAHKAREERRIAGDKLADLRAELLRKWGFQCEKWQRPETSRGWFLYRFQGIQMTLIEVGFTLDEAYTDATFDQKSAQCGALVLSKPRSTVWLSFDTSHHLGKQLQNAKRVLEELQTDELRPKYRARDAEVIRRLLRTYDAYGAGASRSEVAALLHPSVPNGYPDFDGDNKVGKEFNEAKNLVNFGFNKLFIQAKGD
jgi:hypothetical protein